VCDILAVDAAAQYRQLLQLGRSDFLAAAAPAALVRYRSEMTDETPWPSAATLSIDEEIEETLPHGKDWAPGDVEFELYPVAKKPGASFPDRITIGRIGNNDIVIPDPSVSRLHAYVRRDGAQWLVADAGSKNGSWLTGEALDARRERALPSKAILRLGEVDVTFYVASDLYAALGGTR